MTLNTHQREQIVTENRDVADAGLLFMADISGFTRFVKATDFEFGKQVIRELLSAILDGNILDMQVSEIEGDAVLFYRIGIPPSIEEVVAQFKRMSTLFYNQLNTFDARSGKPIELSLKFIVHYGKFAPYSVGGFNKLYGQSVIEIHRLLKNSINSDHYLLLTDNYLNVSGNFRKNCMEEFKVCEMYGDLGLICYTYIPYNLTPTVTSAASV